MARISCSIAVLALALVNFGCRSSSTQLSSGQETELNPAQSFAVDDPIEPMRLAMIKFKCTYGFVSQTGDSYACIDKEKNTYVYSLLLLDSQKNEIFKNPTNNKFIHDTKSPQGADQYYFFETLRNSRFKMNLILGKDLTPRLFSNAPEDIGGEDGPDYTLVHPDLTSLN